MPPCIVTYRKGEVIIPPRRPASPFRPLTTMEDSKLSENSESRSNVISMVKIPPKTVKVRHKGLHGTITFDTDTKKWHWIVNMKIPMTQTGDEDTQEKATLALKRVLDTAATAGKNVTTTD